MNVLNMIQELDTRELLKGKPFNGLNLSHLKYNENLDKHYLKENPANCIRLKSTHDGTFYFTLGKIRKMLLCLIVEYSGCEFGNIIVLGSPIIDHLGFPLKLEETCLLPFKRIEKKQ